MDRVIATVIGIVVAVGVSGIVFVGANKLFDLAPRRWSIFSTLIGGASTLTIFGLLWGNRLIDQPVTATAIATIVGALAGYALSRTSDQNAHIAIGVVAGVLLGVLAGATIKPEWRPEVDTIALVLSVALFVAVGIGIHSLRARKSSILRPVLLWGAIGWIGGAFLYPNLGTGTLAWTVIASVVAGGSLGGWVGTFPLPDQIMKRDIAVGSRKFIFLIPALAFIAMTLVIPLIHWTNILHVPSIRNLLWVASR